MGYHKPVLRNHSSAKIVFKLKKKLWALSKACSSEQICRMKMVSSEIFYGYGGNGKFRVRVMEKCVLELEGCMWAWVGNRAVEIESFEECLEKFKCYSHKKATTTPRISQ